MKISPSTEQKAPNYPALLAAAAVAVSASLASCQQQQQQLMGQYPTQPPITLGGTK